MKSLGPFVAVAGLMISNGCGDEPGGPIGTDMSVGLMAPGSMQIGTATITADGSRNGFVAFVDGQDVEYEPGSQGGYHITVQLRVDSEARNYLGEETLLWREIRLAEDNRAVSIPRRRFFVDLEPDPSGAPDSFVLSAAERAFVCPAAPDLDLVGARLRLTAVLGDPDVQGTLREQVELVVNCPAGDTNCPRICTN